MDTNEIRTLSADELNGVAGGLQAGYHYCGEGDGVRPSYVACPPTYGDLIDIIVATAEKGRQIQQQHGGGRPA
jgi:hypothetical protein